MKLLKAWPSVQDILGMGWKKNPRPLCGRAGVYRIVEREGGATIYIGQSVNLGGRLNRSSHHVYRKEVHDLYVLFEDDEAMRGQMEARFIRAMRPRLNHNMGWQPEIPEDALDAEYKRIFG